jgi:hypothetical protein
MDDHLQQLIELQKKQNALLEKYLWRFRFSLLFLMLMSTGLCIGLGFIVYQARPKVATPANIPPVPKPVAPAPTSTRTPSSYTTRTPSQERAATWRGTVNGMIVPDMVLEPVDVEVATDLSRMVVPPVVLDIDMLEQPHGNPLNLQVGAFPYPSLRK